MKLISKEDRAKVSGDIVNDAKPTPYYYIMIALSCIIATYGLLAGSTAVIIGAMLISPLMTPIIGSSLGASNGNNTLFSISLKRLLTGTLLAIILSIVLSLFIPEKLITAEILSRTKPTLFDLIIALASGVAATYAMCYKPNSAILPGVAISTAILPPLCVVGIGVAFGRFEIAWGALVLFTANIIAIFFSSVLVFNIYGFKNEPDVEKLLFGKFKKHIVYSVLFLIVISIPLIFFMVNTLKENRVQNVARSTIEEQINQIVPSSKLESMDLKNESDRFIVDIVIRSTKAFTNENIRNMENELEYKLTQPVIINADIVLAQQISEKNTINGYDELINTLKKEKTVEIVTVKTPEEIISDALDEKISLIENVIMENFYFSYDSSLGVYNITVTIKYIKPENSESLTQGDEENKGKDEIAVDSKLSKSIVSILEDKLKRKVNLNIVVKENISDKIEQEQQ